MNWKAAFVAVAIVVGVPVLALGLRPTSACVQALSPTQTDIPESWLAHYPDGGAETVHAVSPGVPDGTYPEFLTGALPVSFDHHSAAHRTSWRQQYCGPVTQMPAPTTQP